MPTQTDSPRCCPRFDPEPWDRREITWSNRPFVRDRVRSVLHVPLNFGSVMRRNLARIQAAGAMEEAMVVLSDENSLWGADIYISVAREVPGVTMARLSGTFLCRVFEGPYSQVRRWAREMTEYVVAQGRQPRRLLFYYTTCPRCARAYGRNDVVLLAEV